jgi:hypothetical protein
LVAGEDDRGARLSELSQNPGHVLDPQRIEPGERLVQDQDLGSWTSAAASWTRCWFPWDKTSIRS